jgi:nitroimidazol reductase NimA-like FMN-containing flavoprotein (pyridoxamine 5'-phosphate oxidase superfamily)
VVFGRYDEISDAPKHLELRQRALHLFSERSRWWLPGAAKLEGFEHQNVVVYRIHIDSMTGRRATRPETS